MITAKIESTTARKYTSMTNLFPLADIIPNICKGLEAKDTISLLSLNKTTRQQLQNLASQRTNILSYYYHDYDAEDEICAFDITETAIAGLVVQTRSILCVKSDAFDWVLNC